MSDWQTWAEKLEGASKDVADDLVDGLTARLFGSPPDCSATVVAIRAMDAARSDLTFRSAATALAYVAADDDSQAVEHLEQAFDIHRVNVFLAPSLLSALGLLGLRSAAARAGTIRYLLRLKMDDPRPLLLAGAKVIGLLCDRENAPALRKKLFELAKNDDVAVCAEARQQGALLKLADALLADSNVSLVASLITARDAFKAAEELEEIRPDATLFRILIDVVLQFEGLEDNREAAAARIAELTGQLRGMGGSLAKQIFLMDRSPAANQVANRCVEIASALETAAGEVAQATRWTNFDKSVVRLAECYAEIRYRPEALVGNEQTVLAGSNVADRIFKPRLSPLLARKVGRESLEQVIRNYETEHGRDEVSGGLRALQQAALEVERTKGHQLSEETVGLLSGMAARAGCTPEQLVGLINLNIANDGNGLAVSASFLPRTPTISPPAHTTAKSAGGAFASSPIPPIDAVEDGPHGPHESPTVTSNAKRKRSTEKGEGRMKLIAVLTKHHKYADGGCLNLEPIGSNELARAAGVAPSTASAFFDKEFLAKGDDGGGHAKYKVLCCDPRWLTFALKVLNNEFSPHDLYGRSPPSEKEREFE